MRYLAIDLGDRRTGLAIADAATSIVSPLHAIEIPRTRDRGRDLLQALSREIDALLAPGDELVVGLPLNMDATPGPRAQIVYAFARELASHTGRHVHLQDERLTSADADWSMAGSGLTHRQKKSKRDALAAAAILRDFLETLS